MIFEFVRAVGLWTVIGVSLGAAGARALAEEEQPAPAAAQESADAPSFCRCDGDASANVKEIRQVLAQPLKSAGLDFSEAPLENIVNFLQEEYGIPIQLDLPALDDAGLTAEERVSANVRNVSLRSALRLMLKKIQLTYVIRDEVLTITTPEEAECELKVCVYDVRDLIDKNRQKEQLDAIADVITSCVAKQTWADNGGGEAEIKRLPPCLLVISQTTAVHEEIGSLLDLVRETLRQPVPGTGFGPPVMMGGRGGYGFGEMGMESGYGGELGGGYGGRGAGMAGEMGPEPTPAEEVPPE